MNYMDDKRVQMKWEIPLAEIISDFFDILKEVSSGFATLEYEEIGFRPTEVVKVGWQMSAVDIIVALDST